MFRKVKAALGWPLVDLWDRTGQDGWELQWDGMTWDGIEWDAMG